ncbi:MAG: HEAT repeat domain-containing protein [Planctomycetota bacterium]
MSITHLIPLVLSAFLISDPVADPVADGTDADRWSQEAVDSLERIEIPIGFQKRLVAAEPLVRDPVAFDIDGQGRAYVCESARQENGVEDNRSNPYWLLDDLALETVEDRLAMYEKHKDRRKDGMQYYTAHDDRLTRLVDSDGDGILDARNLFTPVYNEPLGGTLAGVLIEEGRAWITNIPDMLLAQDKDDDGVAETQVSIQRGFGVRIALRGHDMHGVVRGPDGRIYWSIGDRGYHLETADGRLLADPGSGAVFRCEPDGSDLEVVHVGLRNPQELAFDDHGDLFTGDNNSDAGDKARLVQIVWGGESGWRMEYQTLEGSNQRGPWNQEGIWQLDHPVRPVWALPPIAHLTSGPSGLVYYPGTGLPQQNRDCFFLCDFRGSPGNSAVWRFRLEQEGAGFRLADPEVFVNKVLCTDVDFTPDGKMWIAAWGGGWVSTDRGRLMEVWHPESQSASLAQKVGHWLTTDLNSLPMEQLSTLLGHADQRVRQRVQFHLAGGDDESLSVLSEAAREGVTLQARLHGIWGVWQWVRAGEDRTIQLLSLADLCDDEQAEVRAQVARVLGDLRHRQSSSRLVRLLDDPAARVKFHAALALGRIGVRDAIYRLLEMVRDEGATDPMLRHAAVMGLAGSAPPGDLMYHMMSDNREVRLAVLLALRKKHHPAFLFAHPGEDVGRRSPGVHPVISMFLADEDAQIATEAARAIHDLNVLGAMQALADRVVFHAEAPEGALESMGAHRLPYLRRVIDAALRHGDTLHAAALVRLAGRDDIPSKAGRLAIEAVIDWVEPGPRDLVRGTIRPYAGPQRTAEAIRSAVSAPLLDLIQKGNQLAGFAQQAASVHGIDLPLSINEKILIDGSQQTPFRIQALRQIVQHYPDSAGIARDRARAAPIAALRVEAERLEEDRSVRLKKLEQLTSDTHEMEIRQLAIRAIGAEKESETLALLTAWLDALEKDDLEPELHLDVLIAASMSDSEQLNNRAARIKGGEGIDRLADHRWALAGGNRDRGREIFIDHPVAQCQRCHMRQGSGGVAGPPLDNLVDSRSREEMLQSLVDPSAVILEGYETDNGISAMPEIHWVLSGDELRDLLEFVCSKND